MAPTSPKGPTTPNPVDPVRRHTLSVLVQDGEGVISRITGLFTRRGFSIESIASAATERPGINRITMVCRCDDYQIEQITKQLNKQVPVLKVVCLDDEQMVARALLMVKVSANATTRPQIVDAANIFRARVVDVAPESVVIEATGTHPKLRAFLDVLEPFGIKEVLESGPLALQRGPKTLSYNGALKQRV
ncbi:acetolactate synthase small subunit [Corynebacterium mendelii]|uniref:Acetolactate synthase small subunit n=1 Tax=Corynebacterium mendelii TaxID=2765362 RepID=A0A939E1B4_9CORY|nr:acetolactate synthase small subunit [Corynebacterium mendelii]MBN9644636.1 acetolactate synthase small subunit [Corynebacterium mendelii]